MSFAVCVYIEGTEAFVEVTVDQENDGEAEGVSDLVESLMSLIAHNRFSEWDREGDEDHYYMKSCWQLLPDHCASEYELTTMLVTAIRAQGKQATAQSVYR